jgi:competence/damage-inducible protein CinA-like protein
MSDASVREDTTGPRRTLLTAELLAVGSELVVGETVDTNSTELARSLVAQGAAVGRIENLPDDLAVVVESLRTALARADLVVTTGGLGPTPDDLTREAVAEVCGEATFVDSDTLAWLRERWRRRRLPFPESNVKQAWLIPSAVGLPNPHGSAPGWWVDRPDGRVIVLLPGPPREMRPMWTDEVLPRLAARGLGGALEVRTLRLHGIGESQLVGDLGEGLLRAPNPIVATYARQDAVDIRISARAAAGRTAAALADEAEQAVLAAVGQHVWARGATTWAQAIDAALAERGWTLATRERGSAGALVALLRGVSALRHAELVAGPGAGEPAVGGGHDDDPDSGELDDADMVRIAGGADVGLSMRVEPVGDDLGVLVAVRTPVGARRERHRALMRGAVGADRAAIAAAAVLLSTLREAD